MGGHDLTRMTRHFAGRFATLRGHYADITRESRRVIRTLRGHYATLRAHYADITRDSRRTIHTLRGPYATLRGHYADVPREFSHIPMGMAMLMNPHVSAQLLAYQCVPSFIPIYVECGS